MFYDILDEKRIEILPLLKNFKDDFYLAGGTGLALQIGHRDSLDFDFFSTEDIDTEKLFEKIKEIFSDYKIVKIQEEKNTLTVYIDEDIKVSFFTYKYILVEEIVETDDFRIASIIDIACMKLSAILSRATNKDYVDLYFILKKYSLSQIISATSQKMPSLDTNLALKSLIYFDDINYEPIQFKHDNEVEIIQIQEFLNQEVKKLI